MNDDDEPVKKGKTARGKKKATKRAKRKVVQKKGVTKPAKQRTLVTSTTSLNAVLTAIANLRSDIEAYDPQSDPDEEYRQRRALNILGGVEQQLLDACDASYSVGYFAYEFVTS